MPLESNIIHDWQVSWEAASVSRATAGRVDSVVHQRYNTCPEWWAHGHMGPCILFDEETVRHIKWEEVFGF